MYLYKNRFCHTYKSCFNPTLIVINIIFYLGQNKIAEVPTWLGRNMLNLKQLYLYDNQITDLTPLVQTSDAVVLPNLQTMKIGVNQIEILPNEILCNKSIKYLHVEGNRLQSAPALLCCDILHKMVVSSNLLTDFSATRDCQKLSELELENNNLAIFPDFSGNTKLTSFLLDSNQITTIPDEHLPVSSKVTKMSLSSNNLTAFPNLTSVKSTLTYLDLSYNHILLKSLNILKGFSSLAKLFMKDCGMSKMPNLTWAADTILKVQLNNNNITEFDTAMTSGLNILRELHLDGNLISSFSLEIVKRFPALEKLNLQNNQLLSLQDINVPLTAEVSSISFLHPQIP